jgi:pentatricopeptide repeat protein
VDAVNNCMMPMLISKSDMRIMRMRISPRTVSASEHAALVVGKPDVALQLFAKMRFQGLDLDSFAYHMLLNALVEESCFDAVEVILKHIQMRGFENEIIAFNYGQVLLEAESVGRG